VAEEFGFQERLREGGANFHGDETDRARVGFHVNRAGHEFLARATLAGESTAEGCSRRASRARLTSRMARCCRSADARVMASRRSRSAREATGSGRAIRERAILWRRSDPLFDSSAADEEIGGAAAAASAARSTSPFSATHTGLTVRRSDAAGAIPPRLLPAVAEKIVDTDESYGSLRAEMPEEFLGARRHVDR